MAYQIGGLCISCGECVSLCPADAISKGEKIYEIDPEKCISCGTCADNCPFGVIAEV